MWLQVADATTRPLVFLQVPEVHEAIQEAQERIDKTKPMVGEGPIDDIMEEQNLPRMAHLRHMWGYDAMDIGKKMVMTIIYKYLKEEMYEGQEHIATALLSVRFGMKSSTLHQYVVGSTKGDRCLDRSRDQKK